MSLILTKVDACFWTTLLGFWYFFLFYGIITKNLHFVSTKPPLLRFSCKSSIFLHTTVGCYFRSLGGRLGGVKFNDFMIHGSERFELLDPSLGCFWMSESVYRTKPFDISSSLFKANHRNCFHDSWLESLLGYSVPFWDAFGCLNQGIERNRLI